MAGKRVEAVLASLFCLLHSFAIGGGKMDKVNRDRLEYRRHVAN